MIFFCDEPSRVSSVGLKVRRERERERETSKMSRIIDSDPTNNALLTNFLLSSDAEILLVGTG